jgi:tape measure domain-containing protein
VADVENLILRLDAEVDKFNADMAKTAKATERSNKRMQKGFQTTENQVKKFSTASIRGLQLFAAAMGVALSTRELIRYADTWNRVQNRLILATDSGKEAAEALDRITQVAIDSRTDLEATALLYQRLERGTRDLIGSSEELEAIVSTINKSFVISGGTAQEASASIIQLSQAFSRGVLRGDEFRSVMEQAPVIIDAVTTATGVNRGELLKWAEAGALTTEVIIKSIQNYEKTVEDEFGKTEVTIGQAITNTQTEFARFIGTLDETNLLSAKFAGFIRDATSDLDEFVPSINRTADRLIIWIKQWNMAFGPDAIKGLEDFGDTFQLEMIAFQSISKETGKFISDAFTNMPENIKAAIQIAVIEIVSGFDKIKELASLLKLNIEEAFGADPFELDKEREQILENLNQINEARLISIEGILTQRDADTEATDVAIENMERKRQKQQDDRESEEKERIQESGKIIDLKADTLKEEKKAERIMKQLRAQGRRDQITILSALAGDSEKAAQAVFLIDKALAANEVFVNTKVASIRALAELGPVIGPPVAASIEAAGALSIAAILASSIAGFPSGGGGGSIAGAGGGAGAASPSIVTEDIETTTLDVSGTVAGRGGSGVQVMEVKFTADAGDDLGDVMADWMNRNIKKGRIGELT